MQVTSQASIAVFDDDDDDVDAEAELVEGLQSGSAKKKKKKTMEMAASSHEEVIDDIKNGGGADYDRDADDGAAAAADDDHHHHHHHHDDDINNDRGADEEEEEEKEEEEEEEEDDNDGDDDDEDEDDDDDDDDDDINNDRGADDEEEEKEEEEEEEEDDNDGGADDDDQNDQNDEVLMLMTMRISTMMMTMWRRRRRRRRRTDRRGWWESPGGHLQGLGQSKGEEPGTHFSDAAKTWAEVDQLMDAYLTNHVGRRASCSQGCALLRLVSSTFPGLVELKEMRWMCRGGVGRMEANHDQSVGANQAASGHHAAAFGALCAALGVKRTVAQRAFLFMTLRDILSAATRLNLVGPLEAAGLQHKLSKSAEKVLAWAADRPISDVHQTAPLWDLMQGAHDELFAHLFRS
ncbi:hypothetical protein CBR_g27954 [Chara braunii]|uniref:Urease accessory protein UreF n=1 Tax=Chara braunii TaxID=69332 RepID=A0A388L8T5_CHABU|nr:hypothetical protein CBR_g27954 [Chara braunii]|eukprot:GBG78729.1 hypothetical protein CBR_g27954 [Chara braunii]